MQTTTQVSCILGGPDKEIYRVVQKLHGWRIGSELGSYQLVRIDKYGVIIMLSCVLTASSAFRNVQKRRVYDIVNVLEGINIVSKTSKNRIQWTQWEGNEKNVAEASERIVLEQELVLVEADIHKVNHKLETLDEEMSQLVAPQSRTDGMLAMNMNQKAYVSHSDLCSLHSEVDTVMAIRAPPKTVCQHTNEPNNRKSAMQNQIFLQSPGEAIQVTLVQPQHCSMVKSVHKVEDTDPQQGQGDGLLIEH